MTKFRAALCALAIVLVCGISRADYFPGYEDSECDDINDDAYGDAYGDDDGSVTEENVKPEDLPQIPPPPPFNFPAKEPAPPPEIPNVPIELPPIPPSSSAPPEGSGSGGVIPED